MNRKDRNRCKELISLGPHIYDIESMSAKDIYNLRDYTKYKEKKGNFLRKSMLYIASLYLLSMLLFILNILSNFDNSGYLVSVIFLVSTMLVLTATFMVTKSNITSFELNYIIVQIDSISEDKALEIESYRKSLLRKENIDSILNS